MAGIDAFAVGVTVERGEVCGRYGLHRVLDVIRGSWIFVVTRDGRMVIRMRTH